jgi:tetratricopeptide (TPR) repeat protein
MTLNSSKHVRAGVTTLLICLAITTLTRVSVAAQTNPVPAAPQQQTQDPKQIERARKEREKQEHEAARERERTAKAAEKERMNRPAQITINAGAELVRALIVSRAASQGSTIEEASEYKVILSRRVGGMRGVLTQALIGNAYSDEPKYQATFVIVETEPGKTLVTVDAAVVVRMVLGNINRVDLNKNKEVRADIDRVLEGLKTQAEARPAAAQAASAPSAPQTQTTATIPAKPVLSADGYNQAGMALFGQQKLAEAEGCFREAVRLEPTSALYHHNLGTILNAQQNYGEAEKEITEALRLDPNNAVFRQNLEIVRANRRP